LQIGKNLGFSLQRRGVKAEGLDLIRRISIQWLGSNAARLTGMDGLTRGSNAIWAVGRRSGGSGLAQVRQRRGTAGGDVGHGGAPPLRSWGAPNAAGIATGRPGVNGEHQGELQRPRHGPLAAHGGEARRRQRGELGSVLRNTRSYTRCTSVLFTFTRFGWQAPQRMRSDGRAAVRRLTAAAS
jgi:hypothetical protein